MIGSLEMILDGREGSLLTTNPETDIFKWAARGHHGLHAVVKDLLRHRSPLAERRLVHLESAAADTQPPVRGRVGKHLAAVTECH